MMVPSPKTRRGVGHSFDTAKCVSIHGNRQNAANVLFRCHLSRLFAPLRHASHVEVGRADAFFSEPQDGCIYSRLAQTIEFTRRRLKCGLPKIWGPWPGWIITRREFLYFRLHTTTGILVG
jgi:hypothetical protein